MAGHDAEMICLCVLGVFATDESNVETGLVSVGGHVTKMHGSALEG